MRAVRNFSVLCAITVLSIGCRSPETPATTASASPAKAPAVPAPQQTQSNAPLTYASNPGAFVKTSPQRPELNIKNPKTAQEHMNVAMDLHYKKNLDGAIAEYKKALELQPVWALAHFRLGRAYQEKGDLDQAIAQWKLATHDDPHYYDAWAMLSDAYRVKGDLRNAAASYEHLLEYSPSKMAVHYRLGFWYQELGDKAKAREHLQEYIDLALNGKSKEPGTERYTKAVRQLEKLNTSR